MILYHGSNIEAGGFIDTDALAKAMKYRKLNNQYSFHTENAVKYLTKTGAWHYE